MNAEPPQFRFFAELQVRVAEPIEVGDTPQGRRRLIPITGGTVRGDGWSGRVLGAGADFQQIVNDRLALLDARYAIETDQGERIYVHNHAVRTGPPELMAQLARGEKVDPAQIYFRCFPRMECAAPRLAWVNERLFFGTGERQPNQVLLRFFELL